MAYLGHVPPLRPLQGTGELTNDNSSFCLTAQPAPPPSACTNVWARPLASGSTALGWINNGGADVNVTCDSACLAAAGVTPATAPHGLAVRDLLHHADLPMLAGPPYSLTVLVPAAGGGAALRVTPIS